MLEMAAESGTTDIVATPHSDLQFQFDHDLVKSRVAELQARMGDTDPHPPGLRLPSLLRQHRELQERSIAVHDQRPSLSDGGVCRLFHSEDRSCNIFQGMIQNDITPVITHPERNRLLMGRVSDMVQWVRFGCLIQVTAQSFTGRFGKSAEEGARRLMDQRMVHFIASDAHDTEWRPPDMREPYKIIAADTANTLRNGFL